MFSSWARSTAAGTAGTATSSFVSSSGAATGGTGASIGASTAGLTATRRWLTQVELGIRFYCLHLNPLPLAPHEGAEPNFFAKIQMVVGEYVRGYGFSLPNPVFIYARVFSATV